MEREEWKGFPDSIYHRFKGGLLRWRARGNGTLYGRLACNLDHRTLRVSCDVRKALLANDGFTSATDILEGKHGFFQLFKGQINNDMVESLGETWERHGR